MRKTEIERYINYILYKNEIKNAYVIEGILYFKNDEHDVYINDADSIEYNIKLGKLVIIEDEHKFIIDLETDTYYIKDISLKEQDFITIDKEVLEEQLKELNSKTNDTHYFIKNNVLRECNIKEGIQLALYELECIKEFGLTDDYLFIHLKDGDTIYLTKEGSCM